MVVNSRTGTVVIGGDVRVTPATVTHGSLTVKVNEDTAITPVDAIIGNDNQIAAVPGGAVETPRTDIEVEELSGLYFRPRCRAVRHCGCDKCGGRVTGGFGGDIGGLAALRSLASGTGGHIGTLWTQNCHCR